jgi:hypothetical protein
MQEKEHPCISNLLKETDLLVGGTEGEEWVWLSREISLFRF